jgi:hypothetical protein
MTTKGKIISRELTSRITLTGPEEHAGIPTLEELNDALVRMRERGNVNSQIVQMDIERRTRGDDPYDVLSRVHLAFMESGYGGDFTRFMTFRGCKLTYAAGATPPTPRPSLTREFFVLDQLVERNEECATLVHPDHPELTSAMFARVLLVMYGASRAAERLKAFFSDAELTHDERMFGFAVGASLDQAVNTADRLSYTPEPASPV